MRTDEANGHRPARMTTGLATCVAGSGVALLLGTAVPIVGGPAFGIVLGMLLSLVRPIQRRSARGASFAAQHILQASVVLLGTQLSLTAVWHTGVSSLPVMIGTLVVALGGSRFFGRLLGVDGDLRLLVGVGTAVCGASAIGAVTRVIRAAETDVAYSLSTIFAFNVLAVLLFPSVGHAIGLSQRTFGVWGGTAINDTSSVVAATTIYGKTASSVGLVVKLSRALTIAPICLWLGLRRRHSTSEARNEVRRDRPSLVRLVPRFVLYFLLAAAANSIGLVPRSWHGDLAALATLMITTALVGVGLGARLFELHKTGFRAFALGGLLWLTVACSSLVLQAVT